MEVQEALGERSDLAVVAISPGKQEQLRRLRDERGLRMPLLSDPDWSLYREYGFDRGSWKLMLEPAVWWSYARLLLRGRRPHRPTEDPLELGGDALVDSKGALRWIYRSRHSADRPAPAEILRRAEALD